MTDAVLSYDELRDITGYQRAADVERCLRDQGVRVFRGRAGPWTTIGLINKAGGMMLDSNDEPYDPAAIL